MISAIESQRLWPALPLKLSIPPDTVPRLGLPLKNFDTAGQLAHRSDGRHDRQRARQRGHRLLGRLLGHQLLDGDQVELLVLGGIERVRVGRGQVLPRRMVDQIVVGIGAHECDQVGDGLEAVQVVVFAQKRLPLVAGVAPPGRPHGVAVTDRTGSGGWARGQQPCGTQ